MLISVNGSAFLLKFELKMITYIKLPSCKNSDIDISSDSNLCDLEFSYHFMLPDQGSSC